MIGRLAFVTVCLWTQTALAQDVPGIEICTVDKTMEKRTSCLQSNVEFLVKTINRMKSEHEQKVDAANRQIAALKASIADLQKVLNDVQARTDEALAKGAPAKGALPPAKEAAPAAK